MSNVCKYNHSFRDQQLTTIIYKGRPCWVATQVGGLLGYKPPSRFAWKLTREWAKDFIEGVDYEVLRGADLNDFRGLITETTDSVVSNKTRRATVLYEPGMHLALLRTRMPAGQGLRRHLATDVLPQLARDNRYDPGRTVAGERVVPMSQDRSREIALRESEVEVKKRELEAVALRRLRERFESRGVLPADVLDMLAFAEAEAATGRCLSAYKPTADPSLLWRSPTQIAERLGVSVQRVGLTISKLDLRGKEGYSRAITNKAKGHDRTVISYLYSPEAEELIVSYISGGHG